MEKLTQAEFLETVIKVHGSKYDYSLSNYINCRTKIIIICPIHGKFEQTASNHIKGQNCPECGKINLENNRKTGKHIFVDRAKKIHKELYDYSLVNYKHSRVKVKIICKIHGVFEQAPANHLSGQGCYKCGRIKTSIQNAKSTEEFIASSIKIHKELYDYSKVNYIQSNKEVTIICKIHGEFKIKPKEHLRGIGCTKCRYKGYDKQSFIDFCSNRNKYKAIFYVLKIYNEKEQFIKIGITSNDIKERYRKLDLESSYNYMILYQLSDIPSKVWDIENILKKKVLINKRYVPNQPFVGHTESFIIDSIPNIKNYIKSLDYDV